MISVDKPNQKPTYLTPANLVPTESKVADEVFNRARRRAFVQDILAPLRNEPANLLPFEQVREKLRLGEQVDLGLQDVPLQQIIGSVARYQDFNRAFAPRRASLRPRWQRALRLQNQMPPIDLYKVGDVYFVLDGHHRVSVTRRAGKLTIAAHVWEYKTRVPVESNDHLYDILIRQEYLEFLEQSHLDINRPEQRIIFTMPGRYYQLGIEIARHREWMDVQHTYTVAFEEAAVDWFDNIYVPMVQVINEKNILAEFPGRTEADLVAFILRYRDTLYQQWLETPHATSWVDLVDKEPVQKLAQRKTPVRRSEQVARDFVEQARHDRWGRFAGWFKRRVLHWEVLDRSTLKDH